MPLEHFFCFIGVDWSARRYGVPDQENVPALGPVGLVAFLLLLFREQLLWTRIFLKKSRTWLHFPVQSRSEMH